MMSINQLLRSAAGNPKPSQLRDELQHSDAPEIILRRAVIGASMVGIAAMAATTFFQSGVVKGLPDMAGQDFDSDGVNSSDEAFSYGTPDSPLSILSHAVNIALATAGSKSRSRSAPWLPLGATLAAIPAALTAASYLFYQMPVKERRWCPYCIVDAITHITTLGFTAFESAKSLSALKQRIVRRNSVSRLLH